MSQDMKQTSISATRAVSPRSFRFLGRSLSVMLLLAAVVSPQIGGAEPVPLNFNIFTPATNVANMHDLGPGYTGGLVMNFTNVATYGGTTIDAVVSVAVQPNTEFATGTGSRSGRGFIPNYKATTAGQPKGDLGFLYDGIGKNPPGITLTISFFNGTGDLGGRFSEVYVVPDLQLLVYDVDGEPTQAEWFDAFFADGLHSYATGATAASVAATPMPGDIGVHFAGPGKDFPETDTSGAVLLRYVNTNSISLAFGAEQYSEGRNPVFSAIDGSMSLPMTGGFNNPTVVPSPAEKPLSPSKPGLWSALIGYPGGEVLRLDRSMPAEVPIGVPFDYTLKVTNLTAAPVHDIVVTECPAKNFEFQKSDPQAERDGENYYWTVGSLDAKSCQEIRISGVATTAERLKPCATVAFIAAATACADIAVVEPKLAVVETAPQEVLLCDPIPAQIVVSNPGTGAVEGVRIASVLPPGLTTMDGKSELVIEPGMLAAGQSRQFAGRFKASKTGEFTTVIVATANGGLKAEATATTVVRQPVLTIAKSGPARQYLGRPVTYDITVTNKGDAPAADAFVEDTIPAGAKAIRTSPTGLISGSKIVWQLGTVPVGGSKTVSVVYTPAGAGPISETATASAVCADAVTATANTRIYGIAAILLEVIDTDDPVQIGGQTTYVITATNQGSSPSSHVQITAFVESAEEIVSTSGPTPFTVEGNTAKAAPLATLAPQTKAVWKITVKAVKPGDVRFRATMTTAELERDVEETEATQLYE